MSGIYLMMTIAKRTLGKRLQGLYEENGLEALLCTLGRGTATSETLDYFGLEATEKMVMMAVASEETWKTAKRELEDQIQIDVPGTGIAFVMPLSGVGGKKTLQFMMDGQKYEIEEERCHERDKIRADYRNRKPRIQ